MSRKKTDDRLSTRIENLELMYRESMHSMEDSFKEEETEDDDIELDPKALKKWLQDNPGEKRDLTPEEEELLRSQARQRTARHNNNKPS